MKKVMFLTAFLAIAVLGYGQDIRAGQVPSVVLNSFEKTYPKAAKVEWELQGSQYNVEFKLGWVEHEVWMDAQGKIIKHKREILESEIPDLVLKTIKRDFTSYHIDDCAVYEVEKQTFYKIELKKQNVDRTVFIDSSGKITDRIL